MLDRLEHLPGVMALTQLIQPSPGSGSGSSFSYPQGQKSSRISMESKSSSSKSPSHINDTSNKPYNRNRNPLAIEALRLIELSDRTSAVMKSSHISSLLLTDPLLAIYRMYGELSGLGSGGSGRGGVVETRVEVVGYEDMAGEVIGRAEEWEADMVMIGWGGASGVGHSGGQRQHGLYEEQGNNPFDMLFRPPGAAGGGGVGVSAKSGAVMHSSQFVRGVFAQARNVDVALFVDVAAASVGAPVISNMGMAMGTGKPHLFLPFFGGPDDRLALEFLVQVVSESGGDSGGMTATVVRMVKRDLEEGDEGEDVVMMLPGVHLGDGKMKMGPAEEANMLTIASVCSFFPFHDCFILLLTFMGNK